MRPVPAGAILNDHAEAAGIADAPHRRRQHGDQKAFLNFCKPAIEFGLDSRCRLARIPRALFERVQGQEYRAGIGRVGEGRAGEANDIDAMGDTGHAKRNVERALLHGVGARERRAGRKLNDNDDIAAIDLRDESDRCLPEWVEAETDARRDKSQT